MMMKSLLVTFVSSIALVAAQAPSNFYFESLRYGGSGCPQGSVSLIVSNDRTTFTAIFDKFVASIGNGVPITENRKNCQINAKVHHPGGYQFALATVDYRGFANLDRGVTGQHVGTYYFSGQSNQANSQANFGSGFRGDYNIRDNLGLLYYSSCSGSDMLNINSEVRLFGNGNGVLTNDSVDGSFKLQCGLSWRRC